MTIRAFCDGRIFGHVHGHGPPDILALHGWGRTGADWLPVLDGLNAIALDLPGFGASPEPDRPIGAHGYAALIHDVLSVFEAPPIVLAHSFGGRVAISLESDHPGSFSGTVLTGVPLIRRQATKQPPLMYRAMRALNGWGVVSDERMEREKRNRGSADYRAATGVMRDVLVTAVNESYELELSRWTHPCRLIWGTQDTDVPVSVAEQALEILGPDATLQLVEGGGHFLLASHPDVIRSALEDLL